MTDRSIVSDSMNEDLECGNTEYVITKAGRDYIKQLEKCLEERKSDTMDEKQYKESM